MRGPRRVCRPRRGGRGRRRRLRAAVTRVCTCVCVWGGDPAPPLWGVCPGMRSLGQTAALFSSSRTARRVAEAAKAGHSRQRRARSSSPRPRRPLSAPAPCTVIISVASHSVLICVSLVTNSVECLSTHLLAICPSLWRERLWGLLPFLKWVICPFITEL